MEFPIPERWYAPLMYFRFDSDFSDSSTNGFDLSHGGSQPSITNGVIGSAVDLEQDNSQYLYNPNITVCHQIRTIDFWVKPESMGGEQFILEMNDNSAAERMAFLWTASASLTASAIRVAVSIDL